MAQRRRYPRIGEAVSVGLAVLGWLWFVGVLTGYSSAFPAWVPALMGGVATIFALVEVKRENGRRIVIIRGLPNLDWPRRR